MFSNASASISKASVQKIVQLRIYLDSLSKHNIQSDAVILQETWLKENSDTSLLQIEGYNMISQPIEIAPYGGLAVRWNDNGLFGGYNSFSDGYFMYLDSLSEKEGHVVSIHSAVIDPSEDDNICASFYMRSFSLYSLESNLQLYLVDSDFPERREQLLGFDLSRNEYMEWKQYTVRLTWSPYKGTV